MSNPIFKLTGQKTSDEIMDVIHRLNEGEKVSMKEIESLPEIKLGREKIDEIKKEVGLENGNTMSLPNRDSILENGIKTLMSYGSIKVDDNGKVVKGDPVIVNDNPINNGNEYIGEVNNNKRIDIIIGLPSSGKSSVLTNALSNECKSMVIDNDEAKKTIPEFKGGWGGDLVHEESGKIESKVICQALKEGRNIVIPKVGSFDMVKGSLDNQSLVTKIIEPARKMGYTINLHYVDVDADKATSRMLMRYINDGRWMPPDLIEGYRGKIDLMYEQLKTSGLIDGYSKWNNNVKFGDTPILMESHNLNDEYIKNARTDERLDLSVDQIDEIKSKVEQMLSLLSGRVSETKNIVIDKIMYEKLTPKDIIDSRMSAMLGSFSTQMGTLIESLSEYKSDKVVSALNEIITNVSKAVDYCKGTMEYGLDSTDMTKKFESIENGSFDTKKMIDKTQQSSLSELSQIKLDIMQTTKIPSFKDDDRRDTMEIDIPDK